MHRGLLCIMAIGSKGEKRLVRNGGRERERENERDRERERGREGEREGERERHRERERERERDRDRLPELNEVFEELADDVLALRSKEQRRKKKKWLEVLGCCERTERKGRVYLNSSGLEEDRHQDTSLEASSVLRCVIVMYLSIALDLV